MKNKKTNIESRAYGNDELPGVYKNDLQDINNKIKTFEELYETIKELYSDCKKEQITDHILKKAYFALTFTLKFSKRNIRIGYYFKEKWYYKIILVNLYETDLILLESINPQKIYNIIKAIKEAEEE